MFAAIICPTRGAQFFTRASLSQTIAPLQIIAERFRVQNAVARKAGLSPPIPSFPEESHPGKEASYPAVLLLLSQAMVSGERAFSGNQFTSLTVCSMDYFYQLMINLRHATTALTRICRDSISGCKTKGLLFLAAMQNESASGVYWIASYQALIQLF